LRFLRPLFVVLFTCLLSIGLTPTARGQPQVLGDVSNSVADTLTLSPDGKRFAVVTVDPRTKARRVVVDGKQMGRLYDSIARGMPLFSPDGKRLAFVARVGPKCYVIADGAESEGYLLTRDGWPVANLAFSPNSRYLAFSARVEGKTRVVVNGENFGPYDVSLDAEGNRLWGVWDFRFSPDGEYFAYRARTAGKMILCTGKVIPDPARKDGRLSVSPPYDSIGRGTPVPVPGHGPGAFGFIAVKGSQEYVAVWAEKEVPIGGPYEAVARGSLVRPPHDPRRLDYVIRKKGKWVVVAAGKEEQLYDEVLRLMYSADGRHAYVARKGKDIVLALQGVEGPGYDGIRYPRTVFSPDGRSVAFAANLDGAWKVFVNGQPGPDQEQIDGATLSFSSDGKRLAYVAGKAKKRFLIADGKPGPEFDGISVPRFSPDGKRVGYWGRKGLQHFLMVDGETTGPFAGLSADSPTFNADGKHIAHAALKDGQWQVFLNGKPSGPTCEAVLSRLIFVPPDHLAYVARLLDKDGRPGYALVADSQVGKLYDAIWMGDGGQLFPDATGALEYFARKGPLVYREAAAWSKGK
jgi:Tol biopolymer transport system component